MPTLILAFYNNHTVRFHSKKNNVTAMPSTNRAITP